MDTLYETTEPAPSGTLMQSTIAHGETWVVVLAGG